MTNTSHHNSTPEARAKRRAELETYLNDFKELLTREKVEIRYKEGAVDRICSLYYRYADEILRPAIDSGIIQNFKIVSGTELTILALSPIADDDFEQEKFYNTRLALYVALRFLIEWNETDLVPEKCYRLLSTDSEISSFLDEHFKWLYLLNPKYINPIFFNSHVWRLFFYLLRDRSKNLT